MRGERCYWQELADRGGVGGYPRPQVRTLLRHWTGDSRALHLALVVNDHPRIVLKVDELPVLPSEGFPLPDDHCRHHFLPQLWLSLLDLGKDHVSAAPGWQPVQSAPDPVHRNDIQVLGACVVSAVHDGTDGAGKRDPELG